MHGRLPGDEGAIRALAPAWCSPRAVPRIGRNQASFSCILGSSQSAAYWSATSVPLPVNPTAEVDMT